MEQRIPCQIFYILFLFILFRYFFSVCILKSSSSKVNLKCIFTESGKVNHKYIWIDHEVELNKIDYPTNHRVTIIAVYLTAMIVTISTSNITTVPTSTVTTPGFIVSTTSSASAAATATMSSSTHLANKSADSGSAPDVFPKAKVVNQLESSIIYVNSNRSNSNRSNTGNNGNSVNTSKKETSTRLSNKKNIVLPTPFTKYALTTIITDGKKSMIIVYPTGTLSFIY